MDTEDGDAEFHDKFCQNQPDDTENDEKPELFYFAFPLCRMKYEPKTQEVVDHHRNGKRYRGGKIYIEMESSRQQMQNTEINGKAQNANPGKHQDLLQKVLKFFHDNVSPPADGTRIPAFPS